MVPISVSTEFESFINDEVSSGRFRSREEVVAEALRQFREREEKLEKLRSDIQNGIDQLESGESTLISTEDEHVRFFEGIKQLGREQLQTTPGNAET